MVQRVRRRERRRRQAEREKAWTERVGRRQEGIRRYLGLDDESIDRSLDAAMNLLDQLDQKFGKIAAKHEEQQHGGCDHGVVFDEAEARRILGDWQPSSDAEFVMGNPRTAEVRRRFPRLFGKCPKGCGFDGIAYASSAHFAYGDW